jgi:hypothetical protein
LWSSFDRRHDMDDAQSPRKIKEPLSALVPPERLSDPEAIIDGDDTNLCANQASVTIFGYQLKSISELAVEDNFEATRATNACYR